MSVNVEAVEITAVPPGESPRLRAAHAVRAQVELDDYAEAPEPLSFDEYKVVIESNPWEEQLCLGAFVGDVCRGTALVSLTLTDNVTTGYVEVHVPVAHRGQGVGSALYEEVLRWSRDRGRTTLMTGVLGGYGGDAGVPATWHPGARFAERQGLTLRNVEVHRRLALPVAEGLLDRLAADAEPHLAGYRIESWVGMVPEDYREQYGRLLAQLMTDAPSGTLEIEPMEIDRERLESMMRRRERMGRTSVVAVAVAPDGSLVGQTELSVSKDPARTQVFQNNTLVFEEHRGHRLGLALKVAAHRQLNEHFGWLRLCHTWNAEVNDQMIAINELLGYRVAGRVFEYQGPIPPA